MAINPAISLGVQPPQVRSPLESMQRAVTIADSLARMQENQQAAKQRAQEAPVRAAEMAAKAKDLADQKSFDDLVSGSVRFNPETKDVDYGDPVELEGKFKASNIGHLYPTFMENQAKLKSQHRTQAMAEINDLNKRLEMEATPAGNFLAEKDPAKKKKAWPALRAMLVSMDPSRGKILPYDYDAAVVDAKLEELVSAYDQTKTISERLAEAQDREAMARFEDSKLTPEQQWAKLNPGVPMPAEFRDKATYKKAGLQPPSVSTYNKKPIVLQGSDVPADAVDAAGRYIPESWRQPGKRVQLDRSSGEDVYQVVEDAKQTNEQRELARAQEAYAFTLGKNVASLSPVEKVKAETWYAGMTPSKVTEFAQRLSLYNRDPETYKELFGRGDKTELTAAQVATVIGRINANAARQFLTGAAREAFITSELAALEAAGVKTRVTPKADPTPTGGGKIATRAQVEAAAAKAGITFDEAKKKIEAAGGKVAP